MIMAQCTRTNPATSTRCTLEAGAQHDGLRNSQHEVWKLVAGTQGQPATVKLVERWSAAP